MKVKKNEERHPQCNKNYYRLNEDVKADPNFIKKRARGSNCLQT